MHLSFECYGCGRRLRAMPEHWGRAAFCKFCYSPFELPIVCNQLAWARVPVARAGSAEFADCGRDALPERELTRLAEFNDPRTWRVRTPDGAVYGPIRKRDLDAWVLEGRVSAWCSVCPPQGKGWLGAACFYPLLDLTPAHERHSLRSVDPAAGTPIGEDTAWRVVLLLMGVIAGTAVLLFVIR